MDYLKKHMAVLHISSSNLMGLFMKCVFMIKLIILFVKLLITQSLISITEIRKIMSSMFMIIQ